MIRATLLAAVAALGLTATSAVADPFDELVTRCEAQINTASRTECMMLKPAADVPFMALVEVMQRQVSNRQLVPADIIQINNLDGVIDENSVLAPRQYAFFLS